VTAHEVLADLAAEFGIERDSFLATLSSDDTRAATWQDFAISQSAGVTGFPTLIASTDRTGHYAMVTQGFQPAAQILPVVDHWLATLTAQPEVPRH